MNTILHTARDTLIIVISAMQWWGCLLQSSQFKKKKVVEYKSDVQMVNCVYGLTGVNTIQLSCSNGTMKHTMYPNVCLSSSVLVVLTISL